MSNYVLKHHGILGMKWGVRRYQNKDGTLTDVGKKRLAADQKKNKQKPKKNRADEDSLVDARKWVAEDLDNTSKILSGAGKVVENSKQLNKLTTRQNPRLDLSKKTDKELREEINRELLERQYNDVFNQPNISRGRRAVTKTLDIAGAAIPLAAGVVGIAVGINEIKRGAGK